MANLRLIDGTGDAFTASSTPTTRALVGSGNYLRLQNNGSAPIHYRVCGASDTMKNVAVFDSNKNDRIDLGSGVTNLDSTMGDFSIYIEALYTGIDSGGNFTLAHNTNFTDGFIFRLGQSAGLGSVCALQAVMYNGGGSTTATTGNVIYPYNKGFKGYLITLSGTTLSVNYNNEATGSETVTVPTSAGANLFLGLGGYTASWTGEFRLARVYSAAVTYAEAASGSTTNLTSEYLFEEDYTDEQGNNDGTNAGTTLEIAEPAVLGGCSVDIPLEDGNASTEKSHVRVMCSTSTSDVYYAEGVEVTK